MPLTIPSTLPEVPPLDDWWNTPVSPDAPPGLPDQPPPQLPGYEPPQLPQREEKTDWMPIAIVGAALIVAGAVVFTR